MKIRTYVLAAIAVFVAAVTGSDLIARMTIAGLSFSAAVAEHLEWESLTIVGIFFLFLPFVGAALICGVANKRARTRSAVTLFSVAMAVLAYFYFDGFQASQRAMVDQSWTAAALLIGVLPFFGLALVAAVAILAAAVARFDRRSIPDA
ncbi:MAG: hypothetical protein EOP62_08505 [Sphingomonadales bacterium]|nr:MAG: hypothetical protein EOP62_08505 [Sphingomonadales bacterium]